MDVYIPTAVALTTALGTSTSFFTGFHYYSPYLLPAFITVAGTSISLLPAFSAGCILQRESLYHSYRLSLLQCVRPPNSYRVSGLAARHYCSGSDRKGDSQTSCTARTVVEGQPSSISCQFPHDVAAHRHMVNVLRYDFEGRYYIPGT